jgi:hypothetical protein
MAESLRFLRLLRYRPYRCLAELARWKADDPGEFVIRRPAQLGVPSYVCDLEEDRMPPGLADPDSPEDVDAGFLVSPSLDDAQRFSHADAIRLTIRVMQVLGHEIAPDHGEYYEPVRVDVAAELDRRAAIRPRLAAALHAVKNDISREP